MTEIEGVKYCDACGAEYLLAPVVVNGISHCCEDCAAGKECDCALVFEDDQADEEGAAGVGLE